MASAEFGPLTIAFDERVLAPRPWTVLQSEWAAALSPELPPGPILELCAGAGQIGLLTARLTGRPLVQVERCPIAAAFATRNAHTAGVRDYEMRVTPITSAAFAGETFPLIVADPPYLPTSEIALFPDDPAHAIDGGSDGMRFVHECIDVAASHLASGGAMLLQVRGPAQANCVHAAAVRAHDDERAVALLTHDEIDQLLSTRELQIA
jgi:methylase of polypeptide subunit release factors